MPDARNAPSENVQDVQDAHNEIAQDAQNENAQDAQNETAPSGKAPVAKNVSGRVVAATKGSAKVVSSKYKHVKPVATKGAAVTRPVVVNKPAAKPAHKASHKHVATVKPSYKFKSATDISSTSTSMFVTSANAATSMSVNPHFKVPAKV